VFSNVKNYITIFFGGLTLVFWAVIEMLRRKSAQKQLKVEIATRETETRINDSTLEGLKRERDSKDNRNYDDDSVV